MAALLLLQLLLGPAAAAGTPARKNVLLIVCDDLRPELRAYGHCSHRHSECQSANALSLSQFIGAAALSSTRWGTDSNARGQVTRT